MRKFIGLVIALVALAVPAAASAAVVPVTQLTGQFAATNTSVALGPDGVTFGPYANGATGGGSLYYSGFNGRKFGTLTRLAYDIAHSTSNDAPIGSPYLRVFLDTNEDGIEDSDFIFDPTHCATVAPPEDVVNHYEIVPSDGRFNDDGCDGVFPDQQEFAAIQAEQRESIVTGIYITTGFSGGYNLSARLTRLFVNGDEFAFNVAAPTGPATIISNLPATQIVNRPLPAAGVVCKGDSLRTIRAPSRARDGWTFLSATAKLRGLALEVNERAISVDLRNRPEGNYNVLIKSRYRTAKGKLRVRNTERNLSVVCS